MSYDIASRRLLEGWCRVESGDDSEESEELGDEEWDTHCICMMGGKFAEVRLNNHPVLVRTLLVQVPN